MQLHEQYRPRQWSDVVAQPKALRRIDNLRPRGLSGRTYWISGGSGTGKSTIAELLASELADEICIDRVSARWLTSKRLLELESRTITYGLGKRGRVVIVNEAHGLDKETIEELLNVTEGNRIPEHVAWIFTTSVEGEKSLFEGYDDTAMLLSRCIVLHLARRGLSTPFAERAREIAQAENLDGRPLVDYIALVKRTRNNMRAVLQQIEAGDMLE